MTEFSIDRLNLHIADAAGYEHRVHAITARAVALVGERLVDLGNAPLPGTAGGLRQLDAVRPAPVALDLAHSDDETCAQRIATAVIGAIRLQVEG